MKRAEQLAWAAFAGLLVIMSLLIGGGIAYKLTVFWAGAMLAGGQALVVFLAAWGLMLSRQARELDELPPLPTDRGFRMSAADDEDPNAEKRRSAEATSQVLRLEAGLGGARGIHDTIAAVTANRPAGGESAGGLKTIDTSFQRLLVAAASVLLMAMAGVIFYLLYAAAEWSNKNPDLKFPVASSFKAAEKGQYSYPTELALLIGLAMALLYGVLYWITRPRRDTGIHGEAVSSNFTLGITAMAALALGTLLAYFQVAWASEATAAVIASLMLLQGLELLVNAFRSYSAIEELDQDVIDLQATPFGPMLSSIWLIGLRILFAQSVGLAGKKDRGVIARMMPRALGAMVVIAIAASCFRVVPPGQVAVLERLGAAATVPVEGQPSMQKLSKDAILQPGLHICWPWPIDNLILIPTEQLQTTSIGTELHNPKEWGKGVDFEFWTVRPAEVQESQDSEDLFVTGDRAPQILETFVEVQWRVERPDLFYSVLSHSEFADTNQKTRETRLIPIYEAIIKQCTSFAVTRTFSIHELQQIMVTDRREVELHCKEILQGKLDALGKAVGLEGSGIRVDFLTIKDLHPPYWRPNRYDTNESPLGGDPVFTERGIEIRENSTSRLKRGPASAFENVISMSEFKESLISLAQGYRTAQVLMAQGDAEAAKLYAQAYSADRIARAHGDADRLLKITENLSPSEQNHQMGLMKQRLFYATLSDLLDPVNKIITDPDVRDIQIWQGTDKGVTPLMPANR